MRVLTMYRRLDPSTVTGEQIVVVTTYSSEYEVVQTRPYRPMVMQGANPCPQIYEQAERPCVKCGTRESE